MTADWFLRIQWKTIGVYRQVHNLDDTRTLQWIEQNSRFLRELLCPDNPLQMDGTQSGKIPPTTNTAEL